MGGAVGKAGFIGRGVVFGATAAILPVDKPTVGVVIRPDLAV